MKVKFKSSIEYYDDEEKGLKNWTIRNISDWNYERWSQFIDDDEIEIQQAYNPFPLSFKRKVKHKTIWNGYACITWEDK